MKHYWEYFKQLIYTKKLMFKLFWNSKLYVEAFIHDLSEFKPSQFIPTARYKYLNKELYRQDYLNARNIHVMENKHHWQYWYNPSFKTCKQIPLKYLKIMLTDWLFASILSDTTVEHFYLSIKDKIHLHEDTRILIEDALSINNNSGSIRKYETLNSTIYMTYYNK